MTVVDTNVVINHIQGKLAQPLSGTDYAISIVTKIELLGSPKLRAPEETAIQELLQVLEVIPLSDSVASHAIALRRSTNLRLPDSVIAGTALTLGADLITHDASLLKLDSPRTSEPELK